MDKSSKCETALTWTPEGRRKVGRPKTTWRTTIENERRILGWNSWNEARIGEVRYRTVWCVSRYVLALVKTDHHIGVLQIQPDIVSILLD